MDKEQSQQYKINNKKKPLCFNKIDTKEKAYTLGFILCNGCINMSSMVIVTIATRDKEIIDFLIKTMDSNMHYYNKFDKKARIFPHYQTERKIKDATKFTGGRLKKDRHYPIVPKKLERYLLLGAFDADGYITWGRRRDRNRIWQKISFTSQYKILEGIQKAIYKNIGISTSIKPKRNEDTYVLSFSNRKDVLKFLDYIYPNEDFIILHRKYEQYKALRLELEEFGETSVEQNNTEPSLLYRKV